MYKKSPSKLTTIHIAATERYLDELRVQLAQHNLQNKVKTFFEVPNEKWTNQSKLQYNNLERHITEIMLFSEN